jgi:hypothetical protein
MCEHESRANVGMSRERHLGPWSENANMSSVFRVLRREDESSLGVVEFRGNGLHLLGREVLGIKHNGQGIAAEFSVGKDVNGYEMEFHDSKNFLRAGRFGRNVPAVLG